MEILITHKSALQYWRINGITKKAKEHPQRARKAPAGVPETSVLLKGNLFGLSMPLDVTVSTAASRRDSGLFRAHVYPEPMPDRCLVNIGEGFLVASPELCFFQMAAELPLVKLIELGYELCGTYALPSGGAADQAQKAEGRVSFNREPLTSVKRLSAFLAQMSGKHGVKRAIQALQFTVDGSGSPMETILSILLVLPYRLGGYGLPLPEMNQRLDPSVAAVKNPGKRFYKCDLLWREHAVAAEYDSKQYHSEDSAIADDSIKRGDLDLSGIYVVTVTDRQVYQTEELDKVARRLAAKMGKRIQIKYPEFETRRTELRGLLL